MGEVNDSVAPWGLIEPGQLADILRSPESLQKVLLIDSRSFLEFNTCHIRQSINVCCSKLVKRRLQQDKVHIKDLLTQTCHIDANETFNVIVYDQCSENTSALTDDLFLIVLLRKLSHTFSTVTLLKGGFLGFQAMHPNLCESKTNNNYKHTALTSLSQPCLPVSNVGPTRILPFLYLGSQRDALSQETVQVNGISYILNVSTTCPQAPFIQDAHFLRIPVNDNYSEKMQPFFQQAFQFLDTVRNSNGCVLVHCLAGISRSATVAIAYIMKNLHLSSDDAYRYVKEKRPTISPNFNFLGQLLDFEKQLRREAEDTKAPATRMDLRLPASPVAKPNKCPATDHVTLARDSPNTLAVCTNPFPSAMTKSVSCSLSVASCDRVNSDWTPSVVCNQLSGAPNSMCATVDRRTDIETDTHNIHSSKSIPETPSHLSGKVCASGDSDTSSQTHVAPKRATSLPLGKSSGNRSGKTLPLRNVCSPQGAPQWLSPGPVVKSPVTQADVQSSLTQTVVQSTVLSPTTALAKLSFNTTKPSPSITMETQMQLHKFPTTSLDKLNFTPCWVREDGLKKTGGTKRPLSSSAVEGTNWDNLHSPAASSTSSTGSVSPPASHPSHAKVTLRSHSNKAKRTMARPNSIAFSSYPTFDLGSDCQNSPCSSSNTSQDDTSDTYNSKKSRPCNSEQYTEKHLYKKITAAMESAMIKTQAYGESNRKARSLDDILNSGDEEAMDTDCNCNSKLGRISRRCGPRNDLFTATNVLEQLACRCRGTSDPYQSNSSISSSGSHSSLHGSLEIIQPPR